MDIPDLRLLGYMASKPMLRVVRLRDAGAEPPPVSLDTGYALDDCIRRRQPSVGRTCACLLAASIVSRGCSIRKPTKYLS
jgi:hypothetical protein